jgi:hypothetical protein
MALIRTGTLVAALLSLPVPAPALLFAGEKVWAPRIRAFGGSGWTRLAFFAEAEKYCHNGGPAFGHQSTALKPRSRESGAIIEVMAPIAAPLKMPHLQE